MAASKFTEQSQPTAKKKCSPFWVVSMHVLVGGIVIPHLLSDIASTLAAALPENCPAGVWRLVLMRFIVPGTCYVAGTFISISCIRKEIIVNRPRRCIIPSVVAFTIFAAAMVALELRQIAIGKLVHGATAVLYDALFRVGVTIAFGVITARGFSRMALEQGDSESLKAGNTSRDGV